MLSFHAAYDALTEFESLNGLAAEMVPGGWPWKGFLMLEDSCGRGMQRTEYLRAGLRPSWCTQQGQACQPCNPCSHAGFRKRRQNVMGPAVGPTLGNAAVAQFLLAHAK